MGEGNKRKDENETTIRVKRGQKTEEAFKIQLALDRFNRIELLLIYI